MSLQVRTPLDAVLDDQLAEWRARGLERHLRPVWSRHDATVMTPDGAAVDFASNDYLGLASDARLARAAMGCIEREGVGAGAARLIVGHHSEHAALESEIAAFMGRPAALTFGSGWAANVGTIPALVGRGDVIFADALNHASLIDGCRLSRATVVVYPNADVQSLRGMLAERRTAFRHALVVTDGIFSMDGSIAPLSDIVAVAREYDAWTYVDDAHGVGVADRSGRGTAALAGVLDDVDVLIGTFGKAFGTAGAFVSGSPTLRDHLVNRARSFVFSTALPPAIAAASRAAIQIVSSEPARRLQVGANIKALWRGLRDADIPVASQWSTQIVPIMIGDNDQAMRVGHALRAEGLLVGSVRPPTVPDGTARLRITLSAAHTSEQIQHLIAALSTALANRGGVS